MKSEKYEECPICKTNNLTDYMTNSLVKCGYAKCGDKFCLNCHSVFEPIKEKEK